jgi:archaeal cell division control protein 6
MQGVVPTNIFIYGFSGTGKTAISRMLTSQLAKDAQLNGVIVKAVYVDCTNYHTDTRLIKYIYTEMSPETARRRKVFNSYDDHFSMLKEVINGLKGIPIIIFDEIDALKNYNDILNNLARLKQNQHTDKNVCIITITNDPTFEKNLKSPTMSVLAKDKVDFAPYNAVELADIIMSRAEKAFQEGVVDKIIILKIAALSAQQHGDARKAIELLRVSGEIAEEKGDSKILESHIDEAIARIDSDSLISCLRTLPSQAKIILASIIAVEKTRGIAVPNTGEVYFTYLKLCRAMKVKAITQRRVTDILSYLSVHRIIESTVENRGRYGRTKEVSLIVQAGKVLEILLEDKLLGLENYMNFNIDLERSRSLDSFKD